MVVEDRATGLTTRMQRAMEAMAAAGVGVREEEAEN